VATELAAGASGSMAPTIDPYLYSLNLIARPGRSLDEIEAALDAELERVTEDPINERELQKALKQAKVQFVMAGESVTGQAQMIGLAEAVTGDYRWYENALERLAAVTLDDIERVRKEYIRPANRTVGRYLPETRS
jgi:predicted Zn-dependent peptidase